MFIKIIIILQVILVGEHIAFAKNSFIDEEQYHPDIDINIADEEFKYFLNDAEDMFNQVSGIINSEISNKAKNNQKSEWIIDGNILIDDEAMLNPMNLDRKPIISHENGYINFVNHIDDKNSDIMSKKRMLKQNIENKKNRNEDDLNILESRFPLVEKSKKLHSSEISENTTRLTEVERTTNEKTLVPNLEKNKFKFQLINDSKIIKSLLTKFPIFENLLTSLDDDPGNSNSKDKNNKFVEVVADLVNDNEYLSIQVSKLETSKHLKEAQHRCEQYYKQVDAKTKQHNLKTFVILAIITGGLVCLGALGYSAVIDLLKLFKNEDTSNKSSQYTKKQTNGTYKFPIPKEDMV